MKLKKLVVAGNGLSRRNLDLSSFTIIGCNAICRDIDVDYLVACDKRMVKEALTRNINPIYTRHRWAQAFNHESVHVLPNLPYKDTKRQDEPMNWGSGPYAILLACELADIVHLVGFDLYKGNLYKATSNYTNKDVDPSYWIYQIAKIFECYPDKSFRILNSKEWILPKEWSQPNVMVDKELFYKYNILHVNEDSKTFTPL
jgi:hypothetical protein